MPIFPSDEWAKAFQDELNRSDLYTQLAKDWSATYLFAVEPKGPLTAPVYLYAEIRQGKCVVAQRCDDPTTCPADLVLAAPFGVWRKMLEQKAHPLVAIARRQLKVQGNMLKLMQDTKRTHEFFECTLRVQTEFPE